MERNKTIARVMLTAKGLPKHAKTAKKKHSVLLGDLLCNPSDNAKCKETYILTYQQSKQKQINK